MPSATKKSKAAAPERRRYSRQKRRELIIDGAVQLFSERGFDASTHQLAEQLGVTQPLIYSYFPSKDDLLEAVYERVFLGRYKDAWDEELTDRAIPLPERLKAFYRCYGEVIQSDEWMRIYLYSGLQPLEMNKRYIAIVEKRIIERIAIEVRAAFDLPGPDTLPITPAEMETIWTFHGGIFYYGIRRYVYNVPVWAEFDEVVARSVDAFLHGMPMMIAKLSLSGGMRKRRRKASAPAAKAQPRQSAES